MEFTPEQIERIATLARLKMNPEDIALYQRNLSQILNLVEEISKVDTQGITPMAHPLEGQVQRLREDKVTELNQREHFQKIAPQTEAGLYLVPKVIESE